MISKIMLLTFLFSITNQTAFGEGKSLANLFPLVTQNISYSTSGSIYNTSPSGPTVITSNVTYLKIANCGKMVTDKTICAATAIAPSYYALPTPANTLINSNEPYEWMNRCIAIKNGVRTFKSNVIFTNGNTIVNCNPANNEIAIAHLVNCGIEVSVGSYCYYSTVCFEGTDMKGKCTKDYSGTEKIYVQ